MTRCASERETGLGLGWTAPAPPPLRVETPRLILRVYELGDASALFEAVSGGRAALLPWMVWARDTHRDLAETTHFITSKMMDLRDPGKLDNVVLGVFERESGRLVGGTGVHGISRDTASAEAGYWIRGDARGRGYATEAAKHVISWALRPQRDGGMGFRRVRIYCSAANAPSRSVIEKLGIRREVHQREDFFVPGVGVTDRLGWGVMADEWDCSKHKPRAEPHEPQMNTDGHGMKKRA